MFTFLRKFESRQRFYAKVREKYGSETVPASHVFELFEQGSKILSDDFQPVSSGLYGRPHSRDITHLLKLNRLKGGAYAIIWGLSLSYVPEQWKKRVRWHRTLKSSHLDLYEQPWECFPPRGWRSSLDLYLEFLHGETYLEETLSTAWAKLSPRINTWFETMTSIEAVAAMAHEQMNDGRQIRHLPDPTIVYAFSLARLGRLQEARNSLGKFLSQSQAQPGEVTNIQHALAQVGATEQNAHAG